jgi:hypothetical protein
MPPVLQDTYWGDADRDDVETFAPRISLLPDWQPKTKGPHLRAF